MFSMIARKALDMALYLCFDLQARPVSLTMRASTGGAPAPPSLGPAVGEVMTAVSEHRWAATTAGGTDGKGPFAQHDSNPRHCLMPAGCEDPASDELGALIGALEGALLDAPPLPGWCTHGDGTPGPARLTAALIRCAILHATLAPAVYARVIARTREGAHYSTARILYDHDGRKWSRYRYLHGHDELVAGPLVWPVEVADAGNRQLGALV